MAIRSAVLQQTVVPVPLPLSGRFSAHLQGHSQLDKSDSSLIPHGDVRSGVCAGDLLWESVLLVIQVSSDTLGGWQVLHQEGIRRWPAG